MSHDLHSVFARALSRRVPDATLMGVRQFMEGGHRYTRASVMMPDGIEYHDLLSERDVLHRKLLRPKALAETIVADVDRMVSSKRSASAISDVRASLDAAMSRSAVRGHFEVDAESSGIIIQVFEDADGYMGEWLGTVVVSGADDATLDRAIQMLANNGDAT